MYYLKCKIIEVCNNHVIAEINNIAYKINLSNSSFLIEGEEKLIYVFQEFRMEMKNQVSSNLYGFLSKQELELFYALISIRGIGCKTAQTILSNDLYQLSTFITNKDIPSLSKLKGLNWTLANSLLYEVTQSPFIRNIFISLSQNKGLENRENSWNENEVINSLIEIGYEWNMIKKALDALKVENLDYLDNNTVINKCLQTMAQTQTI